MWHIDSHRSFGAVLVSALLLAFVATVPAGCDPGSAELGDDDGDDVPVDCTPDEAYFDTNVWQPVLSSMCVSCHVAGGSGGSTRFVLVTSSTDGYLATNLAASATVAAIDANGKPLLLAKPSGTSHGGGMLLAPGSSGYLAVEEFSARVNGTSSACP